MVGRKQSWVSGRLALYGALSEDLLESIRRGSISTWAATRVIVPIARAIPEHAKMLLEIFPKSLCPHGNCPFCSITTRKPIGSRERTLSVNPSSF